MWQRGNRLTEAQRLDAMGLGYTSEQVVGLNWYITASGDISRRHKPQHATLDERDAKLLLTALVYLSQSPHLSLICDAGSDEIKELIERMNDELFGESTQNA